MGKHIVRITLLPVIMVVALVASMSAGIAQAASYPSSARPVGGAVAADPAGSAVAASGLAPCTTPLPSGDINCESTSPVVDRWWDATTAASSCTVRWTIDWGDGSAIWTGTFPDESPGPHLLASHTYNPNVFATYTETVTSSVVSGPCSGAATYYFVFSYVTSSIWQAWWERNGLPKACIEDLIPDPRSMGLSLPDLGYALGVFSKDSKWFIFFEGVPIGGTLAGYLFEMPFDCAPKQYSDPPLPSALDYGVSHLGKLFKAPLAQIPQIAGIYGYQKGNLVYFSLHYSDPGHDAAGFGFVGVNGSTWGLEYHTFSSPSYGIVRKDSIDYPFNLECGTVSEYKSQVEAWIYDSQGILSTPVQVDLSCSS